MFAVRNRMNEILENFPGKDLDEYCICGHQESIIHIYNCEILGDGKHNDYEYDMIYNGQLEEQTEVFKTLEKKLEKREKLKEKLKKTPCDPPVIHYFVNSNG